MAVSNLIPTIKVYPYLTIIPDRSPVQKLHANLGHAKNAVNYRKTWREGTYVDCELYEWRDNDWHLLYAVPKGTKVMPWDNKEV